MSKSPHAALVVGLGGNLGGPIAVAERFRAVIETISKVWGQALVSSHYLTAPVGPVASQPNYLNAVAAWWPTSLPSPEAALALLQELEHSHGRERTVVGGARTLDLDLLLHAGHMRDQPGLRVPHPRMSQRAFVLRPLQELFGGKFQWTNHAPTLAQLLADPAVAQQSCELW